MLKRRRQWLRIIQVTKWLMSKGQVLTWTTYDTLLLALLMDKRVDEAESVWNTIFADMEELGVRPDKDTVRRIGKAFVASGQEEKEKHVLEKYLKKWKYIHFNGERVRVRRDGPLA
ncbi:Pentatricopeptide repeat-containing protein chloroplastic [Zea mays]|uniref:Pentatricopeptide repeat-containing protein chloroplastic n=1 Tax=Zea mays TaxID=4577 RepID=A0A1D6IER1_MAIZE|nr:Pentatricopeptide repeat-containing protein chloroplastic [Zea mays]